VKVLGIFAASRIITTALLLWFAARQEANPWTVASPDYAQFAKMWDGHWYFIIALSGYPDVLPTTAEGYVGESAWAFMPGYPMLVRGLMLVTGIDFAPLAVAVSVLFAAGTALLMYRLFVDRIGSGAALFSVVLFCVAPLSPVYQLAYAESMHTFLLVLALYLLQERRYVLLVPVILVMALTRPSGLAFALVLLLHLVYRWWRRREDAFPPRETVAVILLGLFSAFMGIAWLLIAWGVTGSMTAYTDTELAWRRAYIGPGELVPFTPWIEGAKFWLQYQGGVLVVVGGILFIVGFLAVVLFSRQARRVGTDVRFWLVSYLLYLLAVFFPQSSTFRLLVPLFPVFGIIAQPRSKVYRVAIVALFVVLQWVWIDICWRVDGADWTTP
jgi:hypothetical protein